MTGPTRHTASLHLDEVRDKAGFLDRCARDLGFPEWFGHNWDALADCLRDLSWWGPQGEGFVLRVHGWEAFRTAAPEAAATAAEVFTEATEHWAGRGTPLTVHYE